MKKVIAVFLIMVLLLIPSSVFAETNKSGEIGLQSYDEGYYKTLGITAFLQETTYYCGPATVKQVVHYLNGSSESQTYYANELGTGTGGSVMGKVCDVVRAETGVNYKYKDIRNFEYWAGQIQANTEAGIPVILDITASRGSGWPYPTDGHYVNTSGFDSRRGGGVKIRITDPCSSGFGNRWYDARLLFSVNYNHFRQAMICKDLY